MSDKMFKKGDRIKFSQEGIDANIAVIYDSRKRKTPKRAKDWRGVVTATMRAPDRPFATVRIKWDHSDAWKGRRYSVNFIDYADPVQEIE